VNADDRASLAALLDAELHDARFRDPRYLPWLYDENPVGAAVEGTDRDDEGRPVAHYALVPQRWRAADRLHRFDVSLHAVVRADRQRRGRFTGLAQAVLDRAEADGARGTITVANARSTPAFVERLGFTSLGSMPVTVTVPRPRAARGVASTPVDPTTIDRVSARLADAAARARPPGLVQDWTVDVLRWRLANPVARYVVHEADDVVGISRGTTQVGLPFAVVVKLFARAAAPLPRAAPVVAAACRAHHAPIAIHAGWNPAVRLGGVRAPRRALPSPLNLVVRAFDPSLRPADLRPAVYEFLDADHY
jgi:GNAT superfamily N-acetyltransferase